MQRYKPSEIDEYGNVEIVKKGWAECSLTIARGAKKKYTKIVGWETSKWGSRPEKVAIVPENWLAEKLEKRKRLPSERVSQFPDEIREKCYRHFITRCKSCNGRGLVERYNYRNDEYFERKCPSCHGSGSGESQRLVASLVTLVEKSVASGLPEEEIEALLKSKNPQWDRPQDNWDGTITSTWLKYGYIDETKAAEIREQCRIRHEETDYDELLREGYDKESARLFMKPKKPKPVETPEESSPQTENDNAYGSIQI
jgi:hypothetical protein